MYTKSSRRSTVESGKETNRLVSMPAESVTGPKDSMIAGVRLDQNQILHVRRRRYLDENGKNVILNLYPTTAEGTRYSEEFAVFLKGADGLDASYRPIVRALFHD